MDIQEIKEYLRIEHDEDDAMLTKLEIRASSYIKNGVGKIDTENELYKQAVTVLVGHWYDNRELSRIGNNSYNIPYSFEAIIQQLKYCYPEEAKSQ
ncbi:head-tail connector protein [Virgibacillus salexigens]|uniref:head-tail connector protein n=1 Tax=Virgibacillus TaxID=84406 RepID=UPI00136BED7F|nr:head-tail connector protein [Virgibacillus massiliensis]MYL41821.1 phage gp6-like head-tail connector protein [Virgibacillus massiliensis]